MISIEVEGAEKARDDLEKARKTALPYAMRDTVNTAAFQLRREWGHKISETFTTRNTYTAGRALVVEKASGTDASKMFAVVGSEADYQGKQEKGFTHKGGGKHLPIPGPSAAGQQPGQKRTRVVRSVNRLRAVKATQSPKSGQTRAQRNAIALAIAKRKGIKYAVLVRPSGGRAIFRVMGSKKKPRTRLVWDLSKGSARVKPHPTLGPSLDIINRAMPGIQHRSTIAQLQRFKVLGY